MALDRCYASAVAMNGSIYIIGGQLKRTQDKTRSVERFDPDVGAWSVVPELTSARCDAAFVNLNGWLYVLGGFDGLIVHSSIEKLGPDGRVWNFGPRMVRQRSSLGAVVFEGRIFVFGGYDGFQQLADGEALDPELGAWSLLAPMVTARSNFGLARSERLFYAVGGFGGPKPGHPLADVEVYDPDLNTWYQIESMSGPRAGLAAFIVDSLPLALKVWDNAEGLRGCRPSEIAASENDASSLEEPILEPLPQEWLQKYQQDQNAASAPSTPLFAITEV
ncbi:kelch-like protein 10 isoform X1 [Cloeon dipterum]|uniref:kelch-like protein 10 isoform X1 n=1 Tax=Cloeon dipterum TaxID=197152 RepID=UPI0032200A43